MKFKILIFVFIFALLSGCQSTFKLQDAKLLSTNHGYLFVNFPRISSVLVVKNLHTHKTYALPTIYKDSRGLWLPEGEYKIVEIGNQRKIKGFPNITIKTGNVTNMGSLVHFNIGSDKELWLPKHLGYESDLLAQHKLKFTPYLDQSKTIEWAPKKMPTPSDVVIEGTGQGIIVGLINRYVHKAQQGELKEQLANEVNVDKFFDLAINTLPPVRNQIPGTDKNGNLYFGSELGVIKKRKSDGSWESIQTEIISEIHIVRSLNDGSLLAANHNRELLLNMQGSHEWQVVARFSENENIEDIDIFEDKIYVATSVYDNVRYVISGGENYELKIYELSSSNFSDKSIIYKTQRKLGAQAHGKIVNGKYYIGLAPDLLNIIDLQSNKVSKLQLPESFSNFNISNQGTITLYTVQGAFSDLFVSEDNGQTWNELDTPPYTIGSIIFNTPQDGIAYRISANLADVSYILQKYNPNKNKWSNVSKAPDVCRYILHNDKYYPKFCVSKSDEIFSYQNGKWVKEVSLL
ncbi:hypothetical protein N480_19715 [Pseudoalteromonas luteoviolacea S2607]|uniref:hypothetical protein n=1 Tax=Pseudoalteromonas luteoviolacea TaxID=43657 RepID=UPI0007B0B929|nr:hypothetical protein [Pseudoalteromonas luteoviolacea]KZN35274.1 hypothetical protein N480_19715 [Pseudoalteromonas luteoviolacea S2607]